MAKDSFYERSFCYVIPFSPQLTRATADGPIATMQQPMEKRILLL